MTQSTTTHSGFMSEKLHRWPFHKPVSSLIIRTVGQACTCITNIIQQGTIQYQRLAVPARGVPCAPMKGHCACAPGSTQRRNTTQNSHCVLYRVRQKNRTVLRSLQLPYMLTQNSVLCVSNCSVFIRSKTGV